MTERYGLARYASQKLTIAYVLIALMLSGCDGGIFGTGDGSEIIDIEDMEPTNAGDMTEVPGTEPSESGNSPVLNPESPTGNSIAFDNLLTVHELSDPLLRVINVGESGISVQIPGNDSNRFPVQLGGQSRSGYLRLDLSTSDIIVSTESGASTVSISPVNLAAGSITTLIVNHDGNTSPLYVLPLQTQPNINNPQVEQLRLVVVRGNSDMFREETFRLEPRAPTPGAVTVEFQGLGTEAITFSDYTSVSPGLYTLLDESNLFDQQLLTAQAGSSRTLILYTGDGVYSLILDDRVDTISLQP